MKTFLFSLLLGLSFNTVWAQQNTPSLLPPAIEPCWSVPADARLRQRHPELGGVADFERWLAKRQVALEEGTARSAACQGLPQIGLVFHILHAGEAPGTGANLSAAQIQAQLDRVNTAIAGVMEFCLAGVQEDGDAIPELGINRINWTTQGWPSDILDICQDLDLTGMIDLSVLDSIIKPATQWDPERFLNVWVIPLVCTAEVVVMGLGQFPIASGLPGLDDNEAPGAASDGIVLLTNTVGSADTPNPYPHPNPIVQDHHEGGIMVHELGHFFGLRHLWGDGPAVEGCDHADYCEDTPNAQIFYYSCARPAYSCGSFDALHNYMGYTRDRCRNSLTPCQVLRMQTVLANSPRRRSLCGNGSCCVETVTLRFAIEDLNGIPRRDFCEGDPVLIDGRASLAEMDYRVEVYRRPLAGGDAYQLVYDFGWIATPLPDPINLGDWLMAVGLAMKGGEEYRVRLSTNATCGTITRTKRFRYHPNNQNIVLRTLDATGEPRSSFCPNEEVWVELLENEDLTSHRYRVLRRLPGGSQYAPYHSGSISSGPPSPLPLTAWLAAVGLALEAPYEYAVELDAWGDCFGYALGSSTIQVNDCLPTCAPPENLRCERGENDPRLVWNPVSQATAYALHLRLYDPACTCGVGAMEDRFPVVTTSHYSLPPDLAQACFSWRVKTVCGVLEAPVYTALGCYSPEAQCNSWGRASSALDRLVKRDLVVYPNPSRGSFRVEWPGGEDYQLRVLDFRGHLVYATRGEAIGTGLLRNGLELEVDWANGLYLLQVKSATQTYEQKIMLVR